MSTFRCKAVEKNGVQILKLGGILDQKTQDQLTQIFTHLLKLDNPCIVADASQLTSLDRTGAQVLAQYTRKLREQGGDIRFAEVHPKVSRLLSLHSGEEAFLVFPNETDAINSYPVKQSGPKRIRLPFLDGEIGLGDALKKVSSVIGIKPCAGCQERAEKTESNVHDRRPRPKAPVEVLVFENLLHKGEYKHVTFSSRFIRP